jgi:flagellar biosynthesis protein FlhG
MWDQAEKLREMVQNVPVKNSSSVIKAARTNARVITVTSGKGGVGKTNFTVNLALALAKMEKRVIILDADLGTGNVDVLLGCSTPYNILHLVEGGYSLGDIISDGPLGIKFMSGGSGIYKLANLNELQISRVVNQISLLDDLADIILIDTGAGINKSVMNFVVAADEVIIVTTPEPTAMTDAYAMMKTYSNHYSGTAPLQLVINRVMEPDEGDLVADKLIKISLKFLGLPINNLGFVFEDGDLIKAVKKQKPLLLAFPNSTSAQCIEQIAKRLLYGTCVKKTNGIKSFFNKLSELVW